MRLVAWFFLVLTCSPALADEAPAPQASPVGQASSAPGTCTKAKWECDYDEVVRKHNERIAAQKAARKASGDAWRAQVESENDAMAKEYEEQNRQAAIRARKAKAGWAKLSPAGKKCYKEMGYIYNEVMAMRNENPDANEVPGTLIFEKRKALDRKMAECARMK